MNYLQTLDWLYGRLPMYQRVGAPALKPSLANIRRLLSYLGNPHHSFNSIHIAGTNGKGSSSHMAAAVLQSAGYKVGLYTSPHLKDFRERIRIDGQLISEHQVVDFVKQHQQHFEGQKYSFFEMSVALAFHTFADQCVDMAVIEVGLGGRLDATNVITPMACLITNIGWDHQYFLGDSLTKIAAEKAGIIKPDVPVVVSEFQKDIHWVFEEKAASQQAPLVVPNQTHYPFTTDLLGRCQYKNIKGVCALLSILKGYSISNDDLKKGLSQVQQLTGLRGRWQVIGNTPKTIVDVAHNKEGLTEVFKQLEMEQFDRLHIVFGMVRDKKLEEIISLFPTDAYYYFCAPAVPRAKKVDVLATEARSYGLKGQVFASVQKAYQASLKNSEPQDLIFIGGSNFVVAEVL